MQVDRETASRWSLEAHHALMKSRDEYDFTDVLMVVAQRAAGAERERICAAIKAEDDHCVVQGDYMLDSDDCIKVARGQWQRPDYGTGGAPRPPTTQPAPVTPFPPDFAQAYWRDRSGLPDL